jgi:RimJ/RimL family protein N-acetyltransferase
MGWYLASTPEIGRWVAAQMDSQFAENNASAIGLVRDGKIVAGVIYENWNGKSVVCHLAIAGKVNRSFLRIVCGYAFEGLEAEKVIGPIASSNAKSIKAAKTIGFVEETRITNAAPNGDIILFTMTADQCRFLGDKHG